MTTQPGKAHQTAAAQIVWLSDGTRPLERPKVAKLLHALLPYSPEEVEALVEAVRWQTTRTHEYDPDHCYLCKLAQTALAPCEKDADDDD